jgi:hypothetical protein
VPWRVEILNDTVAAEIAALPAHMQARGSFGSPSVFAKQGWKA